jgi:hypothetical protein
VHLSLLNWHGTVVTSLPGKERILQLGLHPCDVLVKSQNLFRIVLVLLDKLILGVDVVSDEFVDIDLAVVVLIALAEELFNNFLSVLFLNALLSKEGHHFILVDLVVAIEID